MRTLYLITALVLFHINVFATSWKISSPDKQVTFILEHQSTSLSNPSLTYSVEIENKGTKTIVEKSVLGLIRNNQSFVNNLTFEGSKPTEIIDETYQMSFGRKTLHRNFANATSLTFKNKKGSPIRIDIRVYNDGVAFRYAFPDKSNKNYCVNKEETTFKIPTNGNAWIQPYDKPTQWTPGYEKYYENTIPVGSASPNTEGWAFPALFELQNAWVLLTESDLGPEYCGCRLEQNADNGVYKIRFPEPKDGNSTGKVQPISKLPWVMPWRTIIVGKNLTDIFNSSMVNSLATKPANIDYSWVSTGKASWSWLTENDSPKNFETLKKYVDLAAQMKWEYTLVDANWDIMQGGNIKQLVDYANTKNVGVLMWYNSGGKHNTVSERPRDIISDKKRCEQEFAKLKSWGVKGVKIDFWQSDKQNIITLYHDVLKLAAQNHLLVNLHGCTLPRGWSRTYPNLTNTEAVKGEEAYLFDNEYPEKAPVQNSILAFTRNVVGPIDYTPVVFSNLKNKHLTTAVHEMALTVVFNTGLLHFGDNEKVYSNLPDFVKQFLTNVPVVFDETILIDGYPGKQVVVAARKGNNWYLAGINSLNKPTKTTINLSFIKSESAEIRKIMDNDSKSESLFRFEETSVSKNDTLNVDLLPYGGFVFEITVK